MSSDDEQRPEDIPEGMVRKKRRVRKKRKSSSTRSKQDTHSLFGKAKELLIGMHDEQDDYGHVDVAEQLKRLKNRDSDDDKPLDDVWGTKKRSTSWLWILLIGVIVPVIAIVIGIVKLTGNDDYKPGLVDKENLVEVEREDFDLTEGPLAWYHQDTIKVVEEAKAIIAAINGASSSDEISGLLRKSPYRQFNPIDLSEWGKECLTNALSGFGWEARVVSQPGTVGSTGLGYLKVKGTRSDHSKYTAYFVNQGGKVVLDWEASTGWSEKSIKEIASNKPRKEILVRCLLEKRPIYEWSFSGVEHSGYFVSSPDFQSRIIAYVPLNNSRGLEMERELKSVLNYGSFVSKRGPIKNRRVTLKIRHRSELGESGAFEIVEFEHDDWISP